MRAKTASPGTASRPAAKQRKGAQDKGVIALKGPAGLPRTGKRRAEPASESAGALKAKRLERIRERARVKPAAEAAPEPQPPVETRIEPEAPPIVVAEAPVVVVAEAPPEVVVVAEAPPEIVVVAEAPAVEAPPEVVVVVEAPPEVVVVAEAPPPAIVEATPVERTMTATAHRQPWAPPRPRRPRTAAGLIVLAVSTLIRWGWGLRR
jgi:hypothetical protein